MNNTKVIAVALLCSLMATATNASTHMMLCNIPHEASTILANTKNLKPAVLQLAFKAHDCAMKYHINEVNQRYLSIIDFSLPSNQKRFWVIDIPNKRVLYNLYVAHGKGSGILWPRHFSDIPGSYASSIGLYLTDTPYVGHKGLALRLKGLESNFNDLAYRRLIVIHGASYVNPGFLHAHGRLGRSWGCPAVAEDEIKPLTDTIKDGALLFIYYPDKKWLSQSRYLHC